MADGAQMEADLVLPSGVELDLEEGGPGKSLLDAVVRDGMTRRLVLIPRDVTFAGFVFVRDGEVDRPGGGFRHSLDQSQITPEEGMITEGGAARGVALAGQGDRDQARGAPIEAMQSPHVGARATKTRKIRAQPAEHAVIVRAAVGGNGEKAGRLVHDGDVAILIRHPEREPNRLLAPPVGVVLDLLGGLNPVPRVADP